MENKKPRMIPVDDELGEMLNWAVRYALGRRTYAVADTCSYVTMLLPDLSDKTLWCIERDIQDHEKFGRSFGHECDLKNWMNLLEDVQDELKRRTESKNM